MILWLYLLPIGEFGPGESPEGEWRRGGKEALISADSSLSSSLSFWPSSASESRLMDIVGGFCSFLGEIKSEDNRRFLGGGLTVDNEESGAENGDDDPDDEGEEAMIEWDVVNLNVDLKTRYNIGLMQA